RRRALVEAPRARRGDVSVNERLALRALLPLRAERQRWRQLVQRDVDAFLRRRRRIDWPCLGIDRPPALAVAVDHPALNPMDAGILECFFRRTKDNRLTARAQNRRPAVKQDHPVASSAIGHGRELYTSRSPGGHAPRPATRRERLQFRIPPSAT